LGGKDIQARARCRAAVPVSLDLDAPVLAIPAGEGRLELSGATGALVKAISLAAVREGLDPDMEAHPHPDFQRPGLS
jgi:hypothetical protein